ncbi:MAG: TIGR00288 family NYN domain-containing protein [Methanotrichaceae archaeon]
MDRMPIRFEPIMQYLGSKKEKGRKKIGLLVDGPNMFRKEFQMDLREIRDLLKEYGDIKMGMVFLNQHASKELIETVENQGLEAVVCANDVDVRIAVEGMDMIYNPMIDTLALVSRDANMKPVLLKAMAHGKETIIFGAEPGFSVALKNSADYIIMLRNGKYITK